jgi:hypothetical protein
MAANDSPSDPKGPIVFRPSELIGFVGAGMAGAAYVPQIWHLAKTRCSAGVSKLAFAVWLAASVLMTVHAVAIGAAVFIALGVIQVVATSLVVVYTMRYEGSPCPTHVHAPAV